MSRTSAFLFSREGCFQASKETRMGFLFSWTRNEPRLFLQNYRLRKEVSGRRCSVVETSEWRAGFREDGLSIAGFLKDNRPAGSFVPGHCFQIISLGLRPILGSSEEKADGQREGRKESAIFIFMRAF